MPPSLIENIHYYYYYYYILPKYPWPSLSQCHVSRYIHGHIQGISVWLWSP